MPNCELFQQIEQKKFSICNSNSNGDAFPKCPIIVQMKYYFMNSITFISQAKIAHLVYRYTRQNRAATLCDFIIGLAHRLCRIYASVNWANIASGNGLPPVRRQTITWTNADLLPIVPLGKNSSEIRVKSFHS